MCVWLASWLAERFQLAFVPCAASFLSHCGKYMQPAASGMQVLTPPRGGISREGISFEFPNREVGGLHWGKLCV